MCYSNLLNARRENGRTVVKITNNLLDVHVEAESINVHAYFNDY